VGNASHNTDVLERAIAFAKRSGSLCLGLGDWLEAGTKSSVGSGIYEQTCGPQEQIDQLVRMFRPIAHQFIGILPGNHDNRIYKESGVDVMKNIADTLGIPYFKDEAWIFVSATDEHKTLASYTIYANHSRVTGKTPESIVNTIKRDWSDRRADIRIKGHDHNCGLYTDQCEIPDPCHRTVKTKQGWIVLSGSCLNYQDSYAAQRPYRPIIASQIVLYLDMNRGKHEVTSTCIRDNDA
jgi:hypothetical protein